MPAESTSLTERVIQLEKRLAIYDLIASYGPAVDSGSAEVAAQMWTDNGTYDFGNAVLNGRQEIDQMVRGEAHQRLIAEGAAHMLGLPRVRIDGDRAVAIGYSQVCRHREGHFEVWRISANRWDLSWDGQAWRVDRRFAYVLDGQEAGRALLRSDDV